MENLSVVSIKKEGKRQLVIVVFAGRVYNNRSFALLNLARLEPTILLIQI